MENDPSKMNHGKSVGHPLLRAMSEPSKYAVLISHVGILRVSQALGAIQDEDGDIWIDVRVIDNEITATAFGSQKVLPDGIATLRAPDISGVLLLG